MEIKTSELSGAALDFGVFKALYPEIEPIIKTSPAFEEFPAMTCIEYVGMWGTQIVFMPSVVWADAGPLIEKHQIAIEPGGLDWMAYHKDKPRIERGPTPLVAACRAIVASKLGETVTVPDELEAK